MSTSKSTSLIEVKRSSFFIFSFSIALCILFDKSCLSFKVIIIACATLLVIGAILGLVLAVADKYLSVKEDERVTTVTGMLPGYNCGACGYAGCSGLANGLVTGEVSTVGSCRPCKPDQRAKIKEYLETTPGPDGNVVKVTA